MQTYVALHDCFMYDSSCVRSQAYILSHRHCIQSDQQVERLPAFCTCPMEGLPMTASKRNNAINSRVQSSVHTLVRSMQLIFRRCRMLRKEGIGHCSRFDRSRSFCMCYVLVKWCT